MEPNQEHPAAKERSTERGRLPEPAPATESAQRLETTRDFLEIAYRQRQAIRDALQAEEARRSTEPGRAEATVSLPPSDVQAVRTGVELDARDAGISRALVEAAQEADQQIAEMTEAADLDAGEGAAEAEPDRQAEIAEFADLALEIGAERTPEELFSMRTQSRARLEGEIAVVSRDYEKKKQEAGARFPQRNLREFEENAIANRAHLLHEAIQERDLRDQLVVTAHQATDAELAEANRAVRALPEGNLASAFEKRKAEAKTKLAAGDAVGARQAAAEATLLEDRLEEAENRRERAFIAEASRVMQEMNQLLDQAPDVDQERQAKRRREEAVLGRSNNEIGHESLGGGINETGVTVRNAEPPPGATMRGVTKPQSGEVRGYRTGIERGSMYRREWLAYMVDKAFDLGVVPTTAVGEQQRQLADGSMATQFTSIQKFERGRLANEVSRTEGDWSEHVAELSLLKAAVLDYLILSTDRHGDNFLISDEGEVIAIDNGLSLSAASNEREISSHPLNQVRLDAAGKRGGPQIPPELAQVFIRFGGKRADLLRQACTVALGDEEGRQVFNGMMDRLKGLRHGRLPAQA